MAVDWAKIFIWQTPKEFYDSSLCHYDGILVEYPHCPMRWSVIKYENPILIVWGKKKFRLIQFTTLRSFQTKQKEFTDLFEWFSSAACIAKSSNDRWLLCIHHHNQQQSLQFNGEEIPITKAYFLIKHLKLIWHRLTAKRVNGERYKWPEYRNHRTNHIQIYGSRSSFSCLQDKIVIYRFLSNAQMVILNLLKVKYDQRIPNRQKRPNVCQIDAKLKNVIEHVDWTGKQ